MAYGQFGTYWRNVLVPSLLVGWCLRTYAVKTIATTRTNRTKTTTHIYLTDGKTRKKRLLIKTSVLQTHRIKLIFVPWGEIHRTPRNDGALPLSQWLVVLHLFFCTRSLQRQEKKITILNWHFHLTFSAFFSDYGKEKKICSALYSRLHLPSRYFNEERLKPN